MLDKQGEKRKQELVDGNERYKPVAEFECSPNPSQLSAIHGCFEFDGEWYFGPKKKNGYHANELIRVPEFVFVAWLRALTETLEKK